MHTSQDSCDRWLLKCKPGFGDKEREFGQNSIEKFSFSINKQYKSPKIVRLDEN